jgi:hypothetical protein
VKRDPFDDMHDDPSGPLPPLPVGTCNPIVERFIPADQNARARRRAYVSSAILTSVFGVCGALLAIVELSRKYLESVFRPYTLPTEAVLVWIELAAVVVMLVSWASMWFYKSEWLANRHQAERYRQTKYQLLIQPEKWNDRHWLTEKLKAVEALKTSRWPGRTFARLDHSIERELPSIPFETEKKMLAGGEVRQLLNYYLLKRLTPQKEYFEKRAGSNRFWNSGFFLLEMLLALGVVFAFLHGMYSLYRMDELRAAESLLLAACMPVVAAYVRSLRSSFEFSRNKSRFASAHGVLLRLEQALNRDLKSLPADDHHGVDAFEILTRLHCSEHILVTEHIEWLRLMIETEFFG